jgi:competence protein ComFC
MGWSFGEDLVMRKRKTKPQTELKGEERESNLKGAFEANKSKTKGLKDFQIIIFDDVWTTGTTLKEMCKVLKRDGVKKVWALTIAK